MIHATYTMYPISVFLKQLLTIQCGRIYLLFCRHHTRVHTQYDPKVTYLYIRKYNKKTI